MKLEEIESKVIHLYVSPPLSRSDYIYSKDFELKEFCYFYLDIYYGTDLYFVIANPVVTSYFEKIILVNPDPSLSKLIDNYANSIRKDKIFGKYPINEGIKDYIANILSNKNKIVYENEFLKKIEKKSQEEREKRHKKERNQAILVWIIIFIFVLLFHLIF